MKDQKMLSVRLDSAKFTNFKDFCDRNNITMKEVISKYVDLTLRAEELEKDHKEFIGVENERGKDLLDVQKA